MLVAAPDPPFTGLVCRQCGEAVARIVPSKRLALTCPGCGVAWIASTIAELFADADDDTALDLKNFLNVAEGRRRQDTAS